MNDDQFIVGLLVLATVVSPFLIAVWIGRRFSKQVVIWLALILSSGLLGVALWLYRYGPDGGYGREFTAMLFLIYLVLPVFISAIIAFAIGQWLRKK